MPTFIQLKKVSKTRKLVRQNPLWSNDRGKLKERVIFAHFIIFSRVMNNHAEPTLTRPYGVYVFTYKRSINLSRRRVVSARAVWIRITDPTHSHHVASSLVTDSSVPFMNYDPGDLRSLILIPDHFKGTHPNFWSLNVTGWEISLLMIIFIINTRIYFLFPKFHNMVFFIFVLFESIVVKFTMHLQIQAWKWVATSLSKRHELRFLFSLL